MTTIPSLFRTALNTDAVDDIGALRRAVTDAGGEVDLVDYSTGPVPDWRHLGVEIVGWRDADDVQGATLRAIEPVDPA